MIYNLAPSGYCGEKGKVNKKKVPLLFNKDQLQGNKVKTRDLIHMVLLSSCSLVFTQGNAPEKTKVKG